MADIQALLKRYDKAKSDHDSFWLSSWREARDYSYPSMSDLVLPGQKPATDKVYDCTAIEANEKFASGIYSWCCPPDKRWFELQPQIEELKKLDAVRWYFTEVNRIMYDAINNSNWSMMFHETALNMGSVGTGVLYEEEGDRTAINFLCLNIEKVVILEDKEQRIDTLFREFEYTARQCVQEFGDDCTEEMKKCNSDIKRMEEKFKILHAVFPRKDAQPGKFDSKSMPIASFYICMKSKTVLQESGYWEMPYITPRTSKKEDEAYGRSPTMKNIADIKMLNRFQKEDIYGTEKANNPPVLIPDNCLVDNTFRTKPGGINYYRPGAGGFKPEPFFDGANLPQLEKKIEKATAKIYKAYYNDMFDALGDRRNMSASEIIERSESKLIPFAPVLGRLQAELFMPLIERTYGILYRRGMLPPVPQVLMQYPGYRVEFVSRISIAIKQLEAKGLMQTFESIMPLVQLKPEIMDHFDTDAITRGLARNNGVPQEWILPQERVQQIRQARAQAQAQAQAQATLIEGAKVLPGVSKAMEPQGGLAQATRGA